jgi:CHASE3 domain sensor protein
MNVPVLTSLSTRRVSVRAKLTGGLLAVVVLLAAVFAVGFWGMRTLAGASDYIVHEELPLEQSASHFATLVAEEEATYLAYALTGEEATMRHAEELSAQVEQVVATSQSLADMGRDLNAAISEVSKN